MHETSLAAKMKPTWDALTALLEKARRRGLRGLTAEELSELDRHYRLATIHLAQLRSRSADAALVENLNRLVARAHSVIYVTPHRNPLGEVVRFYATGYARTLARTGRYHLVAALLLVAGALGGYAASTQHLEVAYALLPAAELVRVPGASPEQLLTVLRSGRDEDPGEKLFFASFLMQHNTKVGFLAFASGVMAGLPTVLLIVYTGAFMGAFTAVHHRNDIAGEWWAWILPHGITEIGAATICGGAGLMLGMALLRPGNVTRRKSLLLAGREGLRIALGVIPMFVFAGFIESFLRQSHLSTAQRLVFAAGTALFWAAYIAMGYALELRDRQAAA